MKNGDSRLRSRLLEIRLANFLSFAPDTEPLELANLNILIGPNASGKSNLIEALAVMRSTTVSPAVSNSDLRGVLRRGGGAKEWIWKGAHEAAVLDLVFSNPVGGQPLRHVLSFDGDGRGFRLEDERVENTSPRPGEDDPSFYYRFQHGKPVVNTIVEMPQFDAVADFSAAANPAGSWSYGYTEGLGAPFRGFDKGRNNVLPGIEGWSSNRATYVHVLRNRTDKPIPGVEGTYPFPPDALHMHPGEAGACDVLRWTCSQAGTYSIRALFTGLDRQTDVADVNVFVLVNSTPLPTQSATLHGAGSEAPVAIRELRLNARDTVDFVVAAGPKGFHGAGSTGLQATIALTGETSRKRTLVPQTLDTQASILAQRRDPEQYPEIAYLIEVYEKIRIYRDWVFGRNTIFREPQKADMRNDRLEEDFSNLGLYLSRLRKTPKAKAAVLNGLKDLYEGVTDFEASVEGGSVQVLFTEGDFSVPATRLSDGTLRYLCLLAILCDPDPPPVICIEEPELGLHPDILPKLADLLVLASERTQLIITTHSDVLVDAMTDRPEAIIVCEKVDGRTEMHRLDKDKLAAWLEKYRLGELWIRGEIGGTRW